MRTPLFLSFLFFLSACNRSPLERKPISLDELAIEVFDTTREVAYTNKEAGFYYTETNGNHRVDWQGWHVMSQKMLNDFQLLSDSKPLRRTEVNLTTVLPHQFTRGYKLGVQETVTLLDSADAIVVELSKVKGKSATLAPLFGDGPDRTKYVCDEQNGVLLIAKKRHLQRTETENYPVWIGLYSGLASIKADSTKDSRGFTPATISISTPDGIGAFVLVAGDSKEQTVSLAKKCYVERLQRIAARRQRMENLLNASFVRTNDERFNKALSWAKLSMDALIMNQLKKGIFAGLPWFSNYWGRDSYISLPGASLVTGNFSDAKQILQSFAEWQEKNPASTNEGRIPNLVTTTSIAYNTADGTPWFVIALFDYMNYSGDTAYVRSLFPVVKRSVEGTLRHHVDKNYFLVHGDAETWMDAVGPDGPWTPRGNRANDIQALWHKQLSVAAWFAEMFGHVNDSERWSEIAEKLEKNFHTQFVDQERGLVADHLNTDGTKDTKLRPNQLFTLDLLPDQRARKAVFKNVTEKLVYKHGIASLSQEDENFHAFHYYEPNYVRDTAYHQGIVWTWLAGRWIQYATEFGLPDIAYRVTDDMIHQMLERGAVGSLSELLDAAPRHGEKEPRLSGAFSQAWSLAEFIRNAYQSYLGVSVDAVGSQVWLSPRLPKNINTADFEVAVANSSLRVIYDRKTTISQAWVDSRGMKIPIQVTLSWPYESGYGPSARFTIEPNKRIHLLISEGSYAQSQDSDTMYVEQSGSSQVKHPDLEDLILATPTVRADLKSLRSPPSTSQGTKR
jgi:glycogen debranching enzyme